MRKAQWPTRQKQGQCKDDKKLQEVGRKPCVHNVILNNKRYIPTIIKIDHLVSPQPSDNCEKSNFIIERIAETFNISQRGN